jgi:hypothetical protein
MLLPQQPLYPPGSLDSPLKGPSTSLALLSTTPLLCQVQELELLPWGLLGLWVPVGYVTQHRGWFTSHACSMGFSAQAPPAELSSLQGPERTRPLVCAPTP